MNIENLKNKQRHLPKALLCLSAALALLIAAKVSAFVRNSEQIRNDINLTLNCPGRSDENVKKFHAIYTDASDALKSNNLFMTPMPPKINPVTHVTAVFGDEAYISEKWYKVGDKINDAEITNILPNEVTILWNDREAKLKPFDTVSFDSPSKHASSGKDRYKAKPDKKQKKDNKKFKPERMDERQPKEKLPLSDDERRKRMQEYMKRLTPEQRAKWQERMKTRGSKGSGRSRGGRPDGGSRGFGRPSR